MASSTIFQAFFWYHMFICFCWEQVNIKCQKGLFFLEHPVHRLVQLCFTHVISDSLDTRALKGWIPKLEILLMDKPTTKRYAIGIKFSAWSTWFDITICFKRQKNHSEVVWRKHKMGWYCLRWGAKGMEKMNIQTTSSKRNSKSKMHQAGWFCESTGKFSPLFSDASEDSYQQVSYLRLVSNQSVVNCVLLIGKARVRPLKYVSIPRLKLVAATLFVKIALFLREELDIKINKEYFWTDSKVALGHIWKSSKRFKIFVANRIQFIRDNSDIAQWHYVPTACNPADNSSRGLDPIKSSKS